MVATSRNLEGDRHGDLRHALRQRDGLARLGDSAVRRAGAGGQADHHHRPGMTRFMMTLADAVDLVLYAFEHGNNGDIFVQKAPAATIETLARAVTGLMGKPEHPVNIIGTRHGEKLYEALLSREERACAEDMGDYFRVPADGRDLNYGKFVDQGEARLTQTTHGEDYNSHNTTRLDVDGMTRLLLKLEGMQRIARGETTTVEEC
jgi:UDP-N-acetylglucosamine 4,6-dehydratase